MTKIIELNSINELNKEYCNLLSDEKLKISFDNNATTSINNFLNEIKNKEIIKYYFVNNYYSYQVNLLEDEKNVDIYIWFVNCIDKANDIINSKINKYIKEFDKNSNIWNISICKNIMFNYPFTLNEIIFFPINYVVETFKSGANKKIINTLIHEKIHISQRYNELIWEKFINEKDPRWIKISFNSSIFNMIENSILKFNKNNKYEKLINNPDTFYKNFKYIYKDDKNKFFYGQYVFNDKTKNIKKKFFTIDMEKKILSDSKKELEEEHPYELYAYKIADELVNKYYV